MTCSMLFYPSLDYTNSDSSPESPIWRRDSHLRSSDHMLNGVGQYNVSIYVSGGIWPKNLMLK